MFSLRQYLSTLTDARGLTRTLGDVELCRDPEGRPLYTAGNSAAVFRIRHEGRIRSLRCYLRPRRHLREIYGGRLLEKELFVYDTPETGRWTDVVLGEWIEGETLREAVHEACTSGDRDRLTALAARFDRLAAALVADDWAHGDLKPENLIVGTDGELHPIDLDAAFLPAFAGERSSELGTAAYQHPARTADDFDERIDDYPAALISTALHALALDPSLYARYADGDGLLFTPQSIPADPAYRAVRTLFCLRGRAVQYRIAGLLASPSLRLPELPALLAYAAEESEREAADMPPSNTVTQPGIEPCAASQAACPDDTARSSQHQTDGSAPELFVEHGRWGYRTPQRVVVPPLYDCGFEFTEGLAAVRLGPVWHYIDTAGRTVVSCPGCDAVKPFRGGRAQVVRAGRRTEIDRTGNELDF